MYSLRMLEIGKRGYLLRERKYVINIKGMEREKWHRGEQFFRESKEGKLDAQK